MAAMFSNDTPDKGSGSRSASHKPGQVSGAKKKKKVRPGVTESGQPAGTALTSPLAKPAKTPGFPVATGPADTAVKAAKSGKPSSLRSR